jgi:predicted Zn-dependent protease with MMP-like domain
MTDQDESPDGVFEALVDAALAALPPVFAQRLGSVAVIIVEEPDAAQVPPGRILFGLYEGVPRTTYGADSAPVSNRITIFRGPHLRTYRDPLALANAVRSTVWHEIAHHFGISDERLRELDLLQAGRSDLDTNRRVRR